MMTGTQRLEGSYGKTAIQRATPNAARNQRQSCHSGPERPRSRYRARGRDLNL